ncbi:MAG: A/G-specific adenine glycosylase [Candidatus Tokpelaia sp. JSC085]|nr:MAG: A/G-specific adenine glycosylase [Candidatus Tokpelaia sp. JSC085]
MKKVASILLNWYDKHHRTFPWRVTPPEKKTGRKNDPYHVWLSEIMLQQTTVETVKSYFIKFIRKWPDIKALSCASQDDILKAWSGLGYYCRAHNLKACADKIVTEYNGHFPQDIELLRNLPGIGEYTAAALATIAFDIPQVVVDSNVERVMSRLFRVKISFPEAKKEIWQQTKSITPSHRSGDFAQAMMDLGASLCTYKRPHCLLCPLNHLCLAFKQDEPENFPVRKPRAAKAIRTGIAFVALSKNGRVYLQKRHMKGLLGGMSEIPNHFALHASKTDISLAPFATPWIYQGDIIHGFTHFTLSMSVYLGTNIDETTGKSGWWVKIEDLEKEALPTVMKKSLAKALPTAFKNLTIS